MADLESLPTEGSRLTVAQLKSVLTAQNIELPASKARKAVYVNLYNEHVAPLIPSVSESAKSSEDEPETPGLPPKPRSRPKSRPRVSATPGRRYNTRSASATPRRSVSPEPKEELIAEGGLPAISPLRTKRVSVRRTRSPRVVAPEPDPRPETPEPDQPVPATELESEPEQEQDIQPEQDLASDVGSEEPAEQDHITEISSAEASEHEDNLEFEQPDSRESPMEDSHSDLDLPTIAPRTTTRKRVVSTITISLTIIAIAISFWSYFLLDTYCDGIGTFDDDGTYVSCSKCPDFCVCKNGHVQGAIEGYMLNVNFLKRRYECNPIVETHVTVDSEEAAVENTKNHHSLAVIRLGRTIYATLQKQAGMFECGKLPVRGFVSSELRDNFLEGEFAKADRKLFAETFEKAVDILLEEGVVFYSDEGYLESHHAAKDPICILRTLYSSQKPIFGLIVATLVTVSVIIAARKVISNRMKTVDILVERAMAVLRARPHEEVPISHIRDVLVTKKTFKAWAKATTLIEKDSRVHQTTITENGKPSRAWVFTCDIETN